MIFFGVENECKVIPENLVAVRRLLEIYFYKFRDEPITATKRSTVIDSSPNIKKTNFSK